MSTLTQNNTYMWSNYWLFTYKPHLLVSALSRHDRGGTEDRAVSKALTTTHLFIWLLLTYHNSDGSWKKKEKGATKHVAGSPDIRQRK